MAGDKMEWMGGLPIHFKVTTSPLDKVVSGNVMAMGVVICECLEEDFIALVEELNIVINTFKT